MLPQLEQMAKNLAEAKVREAMTFSDIGDQSGGGCVGV